MAGRLIVLASLVVLVLMAGASIAILRVQGQHDRLRLRIDRITTPYHRYIDATAQSSGVAMPEVSEGAGRLFTQIFGFQLALQDYYLLRWYIVLVVTLAVASASGWLAYALLGPMSLLAIPVVWIFLSRGFFKWCITRRRSKLYTQFPDALALIVRAVRVGLPVSDAIRAVGRELPAPTGPEFTRLANELSIGMVLEHALQAMSERNGLQEYHFFATALSLQNQTGGGLTETLDNLADVIRKRIAVRQRGKALAAEAQTSAIVLAMLPPLAVIGLWFMSPDYIVLLFTDPTGKKILGMAVAGLLGGILSMRYMIRKSLT